MDKEHQMDEEDLEIPEIDTIPGMRRRQDSLETTGADGIPFFLKGEKPHTERVQQENYSDDQDKKIPSFLTEEQHDEKVINQTEPDRESEHEIEENKSSVLRVLLAFLLFAVLTGGLLGAGITVVNRKMRKPQEAPIETAVPEETAAPAATAVPSASPAAENAG